MSNSIIFAMKRRLDDLEAEMTTLKQQLAELNSRPQMGMYSGTPHFVAAGNPNFAADINAEPIKRGPGRPKGTRNGL